MLTLPRRPVLGVVRAALVLFGTALAPGAPIGTAQADDVGQIKVATGTVHVERAGAIVEARVGAVIRDSDVIVTGPDGSTGITFLDGSLLSMGPGSVLAIERFTFDSTTNQGRFESSLRRGTLTAVSGKIAKQTPDGMRVRTPTTILGVRGTEFAVRTSEGSN
jgi:hypothetical protein